MNNEKVLVEELKLRLLIREAIKIRSKQKNIEDKKLRSVLRYLVREASGIDADTEPAPQASTALSALADAYNQVLPVLKSGLRKLKRPEERRSYRAHVLLKLKSIFQNLEAMDIETQKIGEGPVQEQEEDEKLTVKIDDPDRVMPSDGSEDERFKSEPEPKLQPDEDDVEKLAIETEDPTGALRAFTTINNSNIEKILTDTRKLLPRSEDKEALKSYGMYNADLWLLTYEKELADEFSEPPAFDTVITAKPSGAQVQAPAQQFDVDKEPEISDFDFPDPEQADEDEGFDETEDFDEDRESAQVPNFGDF